MKLVERVHCCSSTRCSGQCIRWDVIFPGAIDDVKTVATEFESPTQEFVVFDLPFVALAKNVGH